MALEDLIKKIHRDVLSCIMTASIVFTPIMISSCGEDKEETKSSSGYNYGGSSGSGNSGSGGNSSSSSNNSSPSNNYSIFYGTTQRGTYGNSSTSNVCNYRMVVNFYLEEWGTKVPIPNALVEVDFTAYDGSVKLFTTKTIKDRTDSYGNIELILINEHTEVNVSPLRDANKFDIHYEISHSAFRPTSGTSFSVSFDKTGGCWGGQKNGEKILNISLR